MIQETLDVTLCERGIRPEIIQCVLESGYYLRNWLNPVTYKTYVTISDLMYGNKQFSSSFPVDDFIEYILDGEGEFEPLPPFHEVVVHNIDDIRSVLTDPIRQHYYTEGTLSFRGQTEAFTFRRSIPNPRRANTQGDEVSIMPSVYRQTGTLYSFAMQPARVDSLNPFLRRLEPGNSRAYIDSAHAYDIMRCEQHYARPTAGLDLSFDIDAAVFFATHRFIRRADNRADYERVAKGKHKGVIYCFRFRDPPVKQTQYLIREFDFFKTFRPERLLRQSCALPLIGDYERNIAITDIDCILKLADDFHYEGGKTPEVMFPSASQDPFYSKLLELKD